MIPQNVIETVLMRTDIVELIGQYVSLKKIGTSFVARCPFHQEKTPSFHIHPEKQFYHCFGCNAHGNAIGFLMAYERLDFLEALEKLASRCGITLPGSLPREEIKDESKEIYAMLEQTTAFYEKALQTAKQANDYLAARNINEETKKRFRLGFAPSDAQHLLKIFPHAEDLLAKAGLWNAKTKRCRFCQRIIFPIRSRKGVIAFGGRTLGSGEPKYLNSPETLLFHKGQNFYGLYEALDSIRAKKRVIIVEGYLDCLMLSQYGFAETIATMGTAMGEDALKNIFRLTDTVYFCFDSDSAGQKASYRALALAIKTMGDGQEVFFISLPDGEDPDSFIRKNGKSSFGEALTNAMPLSRFLLADLAKNTTEEKKAQWLKHNAPLLKGAKNKAFGMLLWQKIAQTLGLPLEVLEAIVDGKTLSTSQPKSRTLAKPPDNLSHDKTLIKLAAFLRLFPDGHAWLKGLDFETSAPEEKVLLQGIHALRCGQGWPLHDDPILLHVEKLAEEIKAKHIDVQKELKHLVERLQKKPLLERFNHLSQKPWNTLTQAERLEMQSLQKKIK